MAEKSRLPSREEGEAAAGRRPPRPKVRRSESARARERALDEALANTFPASDPVALISRTSAGAPRARRS